MRVHHKFVYAGVFLVAIGGVVVAADLNSVANDTLVEVLRLWPLALIAIGLGIALRKTRIGFSTGMLAAAVPGLLVGGAFAVAPRFVGICSDGVLPTDSTVQQGSFTGSPTISVVSGCGTLTLGTAPGNGWRLAAAETNGRAPRVHPSPQSLAIDLGGQDEFGFIDPGRDAWDLTVPAGDIEALQVTVNASNATIALPGARIGNLQVTGNASALVVDLSGAQVANLRGRVNAGELTVILPATGDSVGTLRANAGHLQICAPPGVGLQVSFGGAPKEVQVNGLATTGNRWTSPDYSTATYHADLDIQVALGLLEINPIGGCS